MQRPGPAAFDRQALAGMASTNCSADLTAMASESIFIWRIRLCLVLTVAGLVSMNGEKGNPPKPAQMLIAASHAKCPAPPARNPGGRPASGSGAISPAEAGKHCVRHASPTVVRTSDAQKFKPEVASPSLGAMGAR